MLDRMCRHNWKTCRGTAGKAEEGPDTVVAAVDSVAAAVVGDGGNAGIVAEELKLKQ